MSLVNISIVGNLIKPPEQFCFKSGKVKTTLVVAVDASNRKQEGDNRADSDIYRVEAWGKLGEIAHKYLAKGSLVGATGRLVMNHWQDRDGRERVTPTVEASQIALPPKPKAGDSTSGNVHTNPVVGELQFDDVDSANTQSSPPVDTNNDEWTPTIKALTDLDEEVDLPITREADVPMIPESAVPAGIQRRS